MPKVKLKVNRWLCQILTREPTGSDEISISVPEGESILGVVRRLTAENPAFWGTIFDAKTQEIGTHVLVVLNGCIVNPYDRSEALLKDGDEVILLPMFAGG